MFRCERSRVTSHVSLSATILLPSSLDFQASRFLPTRPKRWGNTVYTPQALPGATLRSHHRPNTAESAQAVPANFSSLVRAPQIQRRSRPPLRVLTAAMLETHPSTLRLPFRSHPPPFASERSDPYHSFFPRPPFVLFSHYVQASTAVVLTYCKLFVLSGQVPAFSLGMFYGRPAILWLDFKLLGFPFCPAFNTLHLQFRSQSGGILSNFKPQRHLVPPIYPRPTSEKLRYTVNVGIVAFNNFSASLGLGGLGDAVTLSSYMDTSWPCCTVALAQPEPPTETLTSQLLNQIRISRKRTRDKYIGPMFCHHLYTGSTSTASNYCLYPRTRLKYLEVLGWSTRKYSDEVPGPKALRPEYPEVLKLSSLGIYSEYFRGTITKYLYFPQSTGYRQTAASAGIEMEDCRQTAANMYMHRSETTDVAKREKCRQHVTLSPCTAANIAASDANTAASTAANFAANFAEDP
ncbi:hypothetical protein C8F04DRAFT_1192666 [Mycena alexandri]|uniref:Uncharacterized protein n=1 Tax=Mycena alexandri TaxID=1745969 RepID=A0AAD6WRC2_9AGAR|nr:hypothetical protein C8F04DRAFT_1192666 [Mycena alexandri]